MPNCSKQPSFPSSKNACFRNVLFCLAKFNGHVWHNGVLIHYQYQLNSLGWLFVVFYFVKCLHAMGKPPVAFCSPYPGEAAPSCCFHWGQGCVMQLCHSSLQRQIRVKKWPWKRGLAPPLLLTTEGERKKRACWKGGREGGAGLLWASYWG